MLCVCECRVRTLHIEVRRNVDLQRNHVRSFWVLNMSLGSSCSTHYLYPKHQQHTHIKRPCAQCVHKHTFSLLIHMFRQIMQMRLIEIQ